MADRTRIGWTDATWNPVTGCTKVSEGCANCYAERMARRLKAMGSPKYRDGFGVRWHDGALDEPLHWRKPRMVFVCSMGDLFHHAVPEGFIVNVFEVMRECQRHTFQVLTKRPERMVELTEHGLEWPDNVWAGVSVESDEWTERVGILQDVPARVLFVSLEPLLGPVPHLRYGVDWIIVGGETGPGARPMLADWVIKVRDNCQTTRVPFYFKQWGSAYAVAQDRLLVGREWNEMPVACVNDPATRAMVTGGGEA